MNLPAMLQAITPQTRVIFVANPNNPTGTPRAARRRSHPVRQTRFPTTLLLVMDEAYIEFLDDPLDLASLVRLGVRPNLLLMRTFSKIFGLAGLRIGYGIGHPDLIAALEKNPANRFNINSIAQARRPRRAGRRGAQSARRGQNNFAGLEFFPGARFREIENWNTSSPPRILFLVRVGEGQPVFEAMQKLGVIVRPMGGYQMGEWIRIFRRHAPGKRTGD